MEFLTSSLFLASLEGFALGGGLIIAIGAQNAFLIRQGVRGERVFLVATLCFLSDALLIIVGAAGIGSFIASDELLRSVAAWGGAFFLLVYGAKSAYGVFNPEPMESLNGNGTRRGVWPIVLTTVALTYLNPHVYLDTIILVGGVAAQYDDLQARLYFTAGAVIASCVWFYGLAVGAVKAAPLFQSVRGAQVLDGTVCLVMWMVGGALIKGELGW